MEEPSGTSCSYGQDYNVNQKRIDSSTKPYQVFINHRGPDTKKNFASHLYRSLRDRLLNVFLDSPEFQPGQKLPDTIKEAIRTSSVHIAILSPGYAESFWCLDELYLMLQSDAAIIPVFYGVRPADLMLLQKGEGKYAKSFKELENKEDGNNEKRHDPKRVQQWREALKEVSNISGLELDSSIFNGDEGKLLESVVGKVVENVKKKRKKAHGVDGLSDAVEDFKSFLTECRKRRQNVKTVGIVGTAGSGKTTLAKEFYYQQREYYDRSSLLFEVRKASERNGLQSLQRQLMKDLTTDQVEINNIIEGKEIIADLVDCLGWQRSVKFLIVIDDVDNQDQLDALLLNDSCFGSGSLVIVTSCDKAILKLSGISVHYEIKPLEEKDSRRLLCTSAFYQPEPIPGFEGMVETALSKCGGLPLLLKFIGGHLHLYGNNCKEHWEEELDKISLLDILKTSYGALGENEKQIFLDIACFFAGMEKNSAIRIWGGSGWRGGRVLQKLEYMCLVEIDSDNCLKMQNFLKELGRQIADEQLHNCPNLPCRLWRTNDARNFLQETPVLVPEQTKFRGIREAAVSSGCGQFGSKILNTRTSVKIELLDIDGDLSNGDQFKDLVWLRWKNCRHTSIPSFEMKNLRVLELVEGSFEKLWNPDCVPPIQLREINVRKCRELVTIPPMIELLEHLEKMTLSGAISLQTLPPEFCELRALKHLDLRKCERLTRLPDCFGQLKNLQRIDFSGCRLLSELPMSFGQLTQLMYLDLRNCGALIIHSEVFGEIRSLEQLNFENCKKLQKLPTQITCQGSLWKLNLLGTSLEELPDNIDQLTSLQVLSIGSPRLRCLPDSLGKVRCLRDVVLFKCTQLCRPSNIGDLGLASSQDKKGLYVYRSESI